ncbi:MAG: hypothetical protein D6785_03695, partial [Planctomycetota bacterium]
MPDLVTHSATGYLLKKKVFPSQGTYWFVLGCCLPDFLVHIPANLVRLAYSLMGKIHPYTFLASLNFLHEPLGYGLFCYWISTFFPEKKKLVFWNLLGGGLFHYLLDFGQRHMEPGYRPLYPLYDKYMELGLYGTETTLY